MYFTRETAICIPLCSTTAASQARNKPPTRSRPAFSICASRREARSPASTALARTKNAICPKCSPNRISLPCSAFAALSIRCSSQIHQNLSHAAPLRGKARRIRTASLRAFWRRRAFLIWRSLAPPFQCNVSIRIMSVLSSPHPDEPNWRSLLGDEGVRTPASGDTVAGQQPHLVLEPAGEIQLAAALREANRAGLAVIPRGGGTKLSWGHPPERADVILSTRRLDKVIEHPWADLTVSVEAGVTIA